MAAVVICTNAYAENSAALRILLHAPPLTMNPRAAVDANGQRLGSLIFRAPTRMNVNLLPEPDLAESWSISKDGKQIRFRLREGMTDHGGQPITTARMVECLEQYRAGKPTSALQGGYPTWTGTKFDPKQPREFLIELSRPDPYFLNNASLLRYFRSDGNSVPCSEPQGAVIGSGPYRPDVWENAPQYELVLNRLQGDEGSSRLWFSFIRDDSTRALKLLRGEIDVVQNGLSLAKTRWLLKNYGDRFDLVERSGVNVSYLAFNHADPILKRLEVRQAIAHAIDRKAFIQHKMFGFGEEAGSFLSPLLPENYGVQVTFDPALSEKLLDAAGYKRGSDGVRLRLKYRTTTAREGQEQALVYAQMLKKIGIELDIEVVEPALFLSAIHKGRFQLYAGQWIGVSDGSIFFRSLRTGQARNRVGYSDPEMDKLLDGALTETDSKKRAVLLVQVQKRMMDQMVYLPLFFWRNAVITRKGAWVPEISLSAGLDPLARIRFLR